MVWQGHDLLPPLPPSRQASPSQLEAQPESKENCNLLFSIVPLMTYLDLHPVPCQPEEGHSPPHNSLDGRHGLEATPQDPAARHLTLQVGCRGLGVCPPPGQHLAAHLISRSRTRNTESFKKGIFIPSSHVQKKIHLANTRNTHT